MHIQSSFPCSVLFLLCEKDEVALKHVLSGYLHTSNATSEIRISERGGDSCAIEGCREINFPAMYLDTKSSRIVQVVQIYIFPNTFKM